MVKQFSIQGFRNINAVSLEINHPLTIFYGQNGQGKTNILEALAIVACGSSFRDGKKNLWLPFTSNDQSFAALTLATEGGLSHRVVIAKPSAQEIPQIKLWRNDVPVAMAEFIGEIPVVVFRPEDMNLFLFDPTLRRSFLDSVLFQVFPLYRQSYAQAKKTLTNRNAILKLIQKGEATQAELAFWNKQYQQDSGVLQQYRSLLLAYMDQEITQIYEQFSHHHISLRIQYDRSIFDPENSTLEKIRGFTLSGAHRDDFAVYGDQSSSSWTSTASRGEMRTLVLALKAIIIRFLAEKLEQKPILLLDDILSEFDDERQSLVLSWTANYQLFLTVAGNMADIPGAAKFQIAQGQVVQK